jgi:CcmD family protein
MNDLKRYTRLVTVVGILLLVLYASPLTIMAQEAGALSRQTLGRPYWHVFIAYAIAWVLVFGWLIAMVRRLRRVEERLGKG